MRDVAAEQYAIEYQDGGEWYQYAASADQTEILRLWKQLGEMDVQAPIRLVGFDVLREIGSESA